jgi:hypothetical protein
MLAPSGAMIRPSVRPKSLPAAPGGFAAHFDFVVDIR